MRPCYPPTLATIPGTEGKPIPDPEPGFCSRGHYPATFGCGTRPRCCPNPWPGPDQIRPKSYRCPSAKGSFAIRASSQSNGVWSAAARAVSVAVDTEEGIYQRRQGAGLRQHEWCSSLPILLGARRHAGLEAICNSANASAAQPEARSRSDGISPS